MIRALQLALSVLATSVLACGSADGPRGIGGTGGASGSGGASAPDAGGNDVHPNSDAPSSGGGGAFADATPEAAVPMDVRADSTGPGLSPEEAITQYFAALCTRLIMCCPASVKQAVGGDVAGCKDLTDLERTRLGAAVREGALSGRLFYDGVGMTECVRKFNAAACPTLRAQGDPTGQIPECNMSIMGKVPLNMACADDVECIEGWCNADAGGKCVPTLPEGAACGRGESCTSGDCGENGSCGPVAPPGTVQDGLCG